MKRQQTTAFYVETLALVVAFLVVLLMLTRIFGLARAKSEEAGELTRAVNLAERAAEAVAASDSLSGVQELLDENGTGTIRGNVLEMEFRGEKSGGAGEAAKAAGREDGTALRIQVTWEPDGALIRSRISVLRGDAELYSLETATAAAGKETAAAVAGNETAVTAAGKEAAL